MSRLFLKAKIKGQPSTAQYGLVPKTFARQRKMRLAQNLLNNLWGIEISQKNIFQLANQTSVW